MTGRKIAAWLGAAVVLGAAALVAAVLGARADRVLEIYRQGLAPKILLGSEGVHSNTRAAYLGWRARYLIDEGIPEQALLYDRRSRSSWDEAVNTLQLMRSMKMNRVLVVSDPPHLRRLSWVWGKVFAGSGKEFVLVASGMEDWDAAHWWRTSPNAQFVFGEFIKLAYYLAQY